MLIQRLKRLIHGPEVDSRPSAAIAVPGSPADAARHQNGAGTVRERHSHGLEQFTGSLQGQEGLYVLDLGGLTQANVSFITSQGHRLYSEAFLQLLDASSLSGEDEPGAPLSAKALAFLDQTLGFPEATFDGVLVWDILEFVPEPLLRPAMERLYRIAKPGACLLAMFHANEKATEVPIYSYRVSSAESLSLAHVEMRRPVQHFNNRNVERLFQRFQSVKFFLARDNLREVIVRR